MGGAGILASRLIIQNHVMSLYNFMHWLTMMMMTMTTAMIMTTPTQPDGDRDRQSGTEHRQTVGQRERERPSTDRADRAETYLKKLQLHTQSEWAIAGKRSRVGAGATTCGNHET